MDSIMRPLDDIRQAICYSSNMDGQAHTPSENSELVDTVSIGKQIAKYRKERGLTQAQLAAQIGISRLLLSDYERGKVRVYADIVARIATILKVPADRLLIPSLATPTEPPPSIRLVRRLIKIERLPLAQQKALLKNIDMYLKAAETE